MLALVKTNVTKLAEVSLSHMVLFGVHVVCTARKKRWNDRICFKKCLKYITQCASVRNPGNIFSYSILMLAVFQGPDKTIKLKAKWKKTSIEDANKVSYYHIVKYSCWLFLQYWEPTKRIAILCITYLKNEMFLDIVAEDEMWFLTNHYLLFATAVILSVNLN